MKEYSIIVGQAKEYVTQFLTKYIPHNIYYHKLDHTKEVVQAVKVIGNHEVISKEDMVVLELSAWFHDTGFADTYLGHEEVSKFIATEFLGSRNYPKSKIKMVAACIEATKMPQRPTNLLQKILCDADFYHLSQPDYWKKNNLLKKELEQSLNTQYLGSQWVFQNFIFLKQHHYFTDYGRTVLEAKKKQYLDENEKMLKELT